MTLDERDFERSQRIVLIERKGAGFGSLAFAFLVGTAAGSVAALLLAPRSGAESREALSQILTSPVRLLQRLPTALQAVSEVFKGAAASAPQTTPVGLDQTPEGLGTQPAHARPQA